MAIETPYKGRTRFEDTLGGIIIEIPARKNYFVILFLTVWLTGWTFGGLMAAKSLFMIDDAGGKGFISIWLIGWCMGMLFALSTLRWMLFGREVITIERDVLTIKKKGFLLGKAKSYSIKDMGPLEVTNNETDFWGSNRRNNFLPFGQNGIIRFSYGMKSVRFGFGIDKPEGEHIVTILKDKNLIPHS